MGTFFTRALTLLAAFRKAPIRINAMMERTKLNSTQATAQANANLLTLTTANSLEQWGLVELFNAEVRKNIFAALEHFVKMNCSNLMILNLVMMMIQYRKDSSLKMLQVILTFNLILLTVVVSTINLICQI